MVPPSGIHMENPDHMSYSQHGKVRLRENILVYDIAIAISA